MHDVSLKGVFKHLKHRKVIIYGTESLMHYCSAVEVNKLSLEPQHSFVYSSLALRPFVGPWSFFSVSESCIQQDSLDGGSARRKASTCTQDNSNTE
jgi:hypothetical protein